METTCPACNYRYDDARRLTICPHPALMSDENLAQKDAGLKLLGKLVVFRHHPEATKPARVTSVGHTGMVSLEGWPGEYAPHLFEVATKEEAP